MPRGGRRNGTPGKAYPNRSDLNVPKTQPLGQFKGLPYGQQTALSDAQRAVPVAPPPSPGGGSPPSPPAPGGPLPGDLGDPFRPTERPDEPLTMGADAGAGAGSEIFTGHRPFENDVEAKLRGLFLRYPYPELRELIEDMDVR